MGILCTGEFSRPHFRMLLLYSSNQTGKQYTLVDDPGNGTVWFDVKVFGQALDFCEYAEAR